MSLDDLPPLARHLILMLAASLLSWAGLELVPALNAQPGRAALAGPCVAALVAILTPVVRQYGVGAPDDPKGDHEA